MSVLISVLISMLVLVMKVSIIVIGAGITDINPVTILIHFLLHQSLVWRDMDSIQLHPNCRHGSPAIWNGNLQCPQ